MNRVHVLVLALAALPALTCPAAAQEKPPSLERVLSDLSSTEPAVRVRAAVAAGSLGRAAAPAAPALVGLAIADPAAEVRAAASSAVVKLQGAALPAVTRALGEVKGSEPRRRVLALVEGLGRDAAELGERVIPLVGSEVDAEARRALRALGPGGLEHLVAALAGRGEEARVTAGRLVERLGPDAAPIARAVVARLVDPETIDVYRTMIAATAAIGPEVVPLLIELLDEDGLPRDAAVEVLSRLGAAAVPALVARLRGADYAAASALGAIGAPAVPALVELLQDPAAEEEARYLAANALGEAGARLEGPPQVAAVAALLAGLGESSAELRRASVRALLSQGDAGLTALVSRLDDPDRRVRADVQGALAEAGPGVPDAVRRALAGLGPIGLAAATKLLDGQLGPATERAVTTFVQALGAPLDAEDAEVVVSALVAVGAQAPEQVLPQLGDLLAAGGPGTAPACDVAGGLGKAAALLVPALIRALDGTPPVQLAAVRALGRIGEPAKEAAPLLLKLARDDPTSDLARSAVEAVGALGGLAAGDLDLLLNDEDPHRRELAASMAARTSQAARGVVVVGPLRVAAGVERARAFAGEAARSAIVSAVRRAGFAVPGRSAFPPLGLVDAELPVERLALVAAGAPIVQVVVADDRLVVEVHANGDPAKLARLDVAAGADPWETAAEVAQLLGTPLERWQLEATGHTDLRAARSTERLDWSHSQRLVRASELLRRIGLGERHVTTLVEAACLAGLHAASAWQTDELTAREYFGAMRALVALALRHPVPAERDAVRRVADELALLEARFGRGEEAPVPAEALLPELQLLRRNLDAPSLEGPTGPAPERAVESRFDFLCRRTLAIFAARTKSVLFEWVRQRPDPDTMLTWAKGVRWDPPFEAAQYALDAADASDMRTEVAELAGELGFGPQLEAINAEFFEEGRSRWKSLDSADRGQSKDLHTLVLLHFAVGLERAAGAASPTRDGSLGLGEVGLELARRLQQVVLLRRARFADLGWDDQRREVDLMLDLYGRERLVVNRDWPDLPTLDRRQGAFSRQVVETIARLRELVDHGRVEEACQLVAPRLPLVAPSAEFADAKDGAFHLFLRAGKVREGLREFSALNATGFEREQFRFTVLRWADQDLASWSGYFSEGTHSARDYITRADFAFRTGDLSTTLAVAGKYHYEPRSDHIVALEALARLCGRPDDPDGWAVAEAALKRLEARGNTDEWPAWGERLGKELGADPRWAALQERLDWSSHVRLHRAEDALVLPADEARLEALLGELQALLDQRAADGVLNDDNLYEGALRCTHLALARWILARTNRLEARLDDAALLERVRRAVDHAAAHCNDALSRGVRFVPTWAQSPTWFLSFLVTQGAPPAAVARFAAGIPWLGEHVGRDRQLERWRCSALRSPRLLEALLTSVPRDSYDPHALRVPALNDEAAFAAAFDAGEDEPAQLIALRRAHETGQLGDLLRYLPDEPWARAWVEEWAPDRPTARAWLVAMQSPPAEVVEARRRRATARPLPSSLPGLDVVVGEP